MKTSDIEKILQETGPICVSIIIPMQNIPSDKTKEPKAVSRAKELLEKHKEVSHSLVIELIEKIDRLVGQIQYGHPDEGVGIFVSANTAEFCKFPFEVVEKVTVKDSFESRDLLYYRNLMLDYYVLYISKKHIHFLKGSGKKLEEVVNEDFPIDYVENYEYEKPSRGSSYGGALKDYEKDKSIMQEIRLVDFLKVADQHLKSYLTDGAPLVLSGGSKEIADFMSITHYKKIIIGKVIGNFHFNGNVMLTSLSWDQIKSYLKKENEHLLDDLRELTGKDMVALGLSDTWKAANDGKGLKLVIEKDFEKDGFVSADGYELKLSDASGSKKYEHDDEIVERIIKTVRDKKGQVVFVENGEMDFFDKIALQLRYSAH